VRLVCVIPARYHSTRLPGKPLRLLGGEPLIRVVARRAVDLGVTGEVVVASDDPRVLDAVAGLAVEPELTARTHASGTERVAEVAARRGLTDTDIVLNLQGDEPFLPRAAAEGAIGRVASGDDIGTAAQPLSAGGRRDPNRVKVELDGRGRALRFYRTPPAPACARPAPAFQHLGLYAYRAAALRAWLSFPPVAAEAAEGLEQLRPLAHGLRIGVAVLPAPAPHGIDTERDLQLAEALL
jgi:3-deoxy-manno-octulosonate cytidylyltransferase (CMP-KDO synthetase)